jgi:hypothetical protein
MIYFSPGGDGSVVYPLNWTWTWQSSGNPVTVEVTQNKINLHIWAGTVLHGVFDASAVAWRYYNEGYWRVVTCK